MNMQGIENRISFQDMAEELIQKSHLLALVKGENQMHWAEAFDKDCLAVNTLLKILVSDLMKITGVPVKVMYINPIYFRHVCIQKYDTDELRVKGIWSAFNSYLKKFPDNIINNILNATITENKDDFSVPMVEEGSIFPLTPITHTEDTVKFKAIEANNVGGESLSEITLTRYGYIDPVDCVLHVPSTVKEKLNVLQTTILNYHPKILQGTQVKKHELLNHKTKQDKIYESDLALVIHFGLKYPPHVIEFWEDPLTAIAQPVLKAPSNKNFFCEIVFFAALSSLALIFVVYQLFFTQVPSITSFFIFVVSGFCTMFLGGWTFGILTRHQEQVDNWYRLTKKVPRRTLILQSYSSI